RDLGLAGGGERLARGGQAPRDARELRSRQLLASDERSHVALEPLLEGHRALEESSPVACGGGLPVRRDHVERALGVRVAELVEARPVARADRRLAGAGALPPESPRQRRLELAPLERREGVRDPLAAERRLERLVD